MNLWQQMIKASDAAIEQSDSIDNVDAAIAAAHLEVALRWMNAVGPVRIQQELNAAWRAANIDPTP
ncbi:MAG: hypothetical protein ACK41W_13210 [Cyanobacteriota bacterium]|jgi:hypothetical protein